MCISCMSSCANSVNDAIEETEKEYKDEYADKNGKKSFKIGESFENKHLKVTVSEVNANWKGYDSYSKPENGKKIVRIAINAENIGKESHDISSLYFNCYADDVIVDEYIWAGDSTEFGGTISPSKKTTGALYYEVPINSQKLILEYEPNVLDSEFIVQFELRKIFIFLFLHNTFYLGNNNREMESIMNNVNFVKNIDNLGRIVIPMDIRRKLNINTGDVLNITCNDKNIMLTKYSSLSNNMKIIEIIKYFIEMFNLKVILVSKEMVIYSNLVSNGIILDEKMKLMVKNGNNIRSAQSDYIFGDNKVSGIYNMLPIVTNEGIEGSIIVFDDTGSTRFEICNLLSKLIMLELNIT